MKKKTDSTQKPNLSEIARRFHISRDRARWLMANTEPAEVRGQTRLFNISDVLAAMKSEHGPIPTEKQQQTKALKEQKLAEQVKRLRLENDRTEERLIHVDVVRAEYAKINDASRKILHWRSLLTRRDRLKSGLARAQKRLDYTRNAYQQIQDGAKDHLLTGETDERGRPADTGISELATTLAAQRELMELLPGTIQRTEAALEQAEKDVADYANKHGFTDPSTVPEPEPEDQDAEDDGEENEDDDSEEAEETEFAPEPQLVT